MLSDEDPALQPLQYSSDSRRSRDRRMVMMNRKKFIAIAIFVVLVSVIIGIVIGYNTKSSSSENDIKPSSSGTDVVDLLMKEMKPANIKENLGVLVENVHVAGMKSEEGYLVDFIVDKWKVQLDEVKVYPYNILLSYPNDTDPNYVGVINEKNETYDKSETLEPALPPSKEDFTTINSTYNGYAAAGHVEGDLVFVNFGTTLDFEMLISTYEVDVKGKICIAKYGKVFRGDKVTNGEKYGCVGLIMFTDPENYGDREDVNNTFPYSWWMPHTGVQRGSVYMGEGDPLTPFYPSIDSAYRIPENETVLPRIPVQPVSSDDAYKYLSKIGGKEAPADWQGGLNITYNIGGVMKPEYKDHKVLLHVANFRKIMEVKNIIGYIRGEVEPDRYVIIGNHRDAWVFGALDPSSGTAVMMEIARAMGEIVKGGKWRPRRTIIFCSWGAEEFGLLGSTEWVEEFEKKLLVQAVTYLNVDIAVQGSTTLRAKATPNLRRILYEVAKLVPNPDEKEVEQHRPTVYDTWKLKYPDKEDNSRPAVKALGSGSDYASFIQKTGVSSVDFRYTYDEINLKLSSYPIYHSAHETIEYFEKFIDPHYSYSLAVARVWGELTRRVADEVLIPFECVDYAMEIKNMIFKISEENADVLKKNGIKLDYLHEAVETLVKSALKLNDTIATVNKSSLHEVRQLNDKIMYLDRGFLDFNGLPGRRHLRHIVYAPSIHDMYSGAGFPGFVDAIHDAKLDGNWEPVKQQLSVITYHIGSAASVLSPFF